jgi:hypothetical protein
MLPFLLLLLFVIGCQSTQTITYPSNGAAMDNPVTLVSTRVTTWHSNVDGTLGRGDRINVRLSPGRHEIQTDNGSVWFTVKEDFPLGVVRQTSVPSLPRGQFDVVALGGARAVSRSSYLSLNERLIMRLSKQSKQASPRIKTQSQAFGKSEFKLLDLQTFQSYRQEFYLVVTTQNAAVYIDARDKNNKTEEQILGLLPQIDRVLETDKFNFGLPSDIDQNGVVNILFTGALNRSELAIGYFYANDLLEQDASNPDSNQGEFIYAGVPDPDDVNYAPSSILATVCHEFVHAIGFAQKTLARLNLPEPPIQSVAIDEGMSHMAEDLCGYNQSGGNLAFVAEYLKAPEQTSVSGLDYRGRGDTPARRGAAYTLVRFALEEAGRLGVSNYLKRVVSSKYTDVDSLSEPLGMTSAELLKRWRWALLDNRFNAPVIGLTGEEIGLNLLRGELPKPFAIRLNGVRQLEAIPKAWAANANLYLSNDQAVPREVRRRQ